MQKDRESISSLFVIIDKQYTIWFEEQTYRELFLLEWANSFLSQKTLNRKIKCFIIS